MVVFIHGDSFVRGSGNLYDDAGAFAAEADVVVVTINYRLGALGESVRNRGKCSLCLDRSHVALCVCVA